MSHEKYMVVVGSGTLGFDRILIDHPGLTAPLDLGPPRIDITLRPERILPEIDFPTLRTPKVRDWEQRERKRRRR